MPPIHARVIRIASFRRVLLIPFIAAFAVSKFRTILSRVFVVSACVAVTVNAAKAFDVHELFRFTESDSAPLELFGWSVAVNGNIALIGAPGDDLAGFESGSAYLFDLTSGQQIFKLNASDAAPLKNFGWSVAMSGNTAIVGARGDYLSGTRGAAYVFDLTTGTQIHKLTDTAALFGFGDKVGISGNVAIVNNPLDSVGHTYSGSSYLFDVTTGQKVFKLTASDAAAEKFFGSDVAVSGSIAVVGASGDRHAGSQSGSAYLFDVTTGQQLVKLTASDATLDADFGYSVAISGATAIVGAYRDGFPNAFGAAYLFDATTGQELFKLKSSDGALSYRFGSSVAITGNLAMVGNLAADGQGAAFLFDIATGQELLKIPAPDTVPMDQFFGQSVVLSGNSAIVGSPADYFGTSASGAAFVFRIVPEPSALLLLFAAFAFISPRSSRLRMPFGLLIAPTRWLWQRTTV
ncbi:MAG: PQQ-binding-like beta-propeller repeat protein [Pirellulales bacterium]